MMISQLKIKRQNKNKVKRTEERRKMVRKVNNHYLKRKSPTMTITTMMTMKLKIKRQNQKKVKKTEEIRKRVNKL